MAHVRFRLVLLYPYPDTVHGGTLHETLRSTSLTERGFPHADPKEAFGSAVHPPLKRHAETLKPQVTPAKLPHGTRTIPLSAAISLS